MKQLARFAATIVLGLILLLGVAGTRSIAQSPNQIGLVVRLGDGSTITRCVKISEPQISGYEVLTRSGLAVIASASSGMGSTICKIEDEGCPSNNCFCQCQGATCTYWSYWHLEEGQWAYSLLGANAFKVQPGAVEGWSWGADSPPETSFEQICAPAVTATSTPPPATATPTPTHTTTPLPTATSAPTTMPISTSTLMPAASTPRPTATYTPVRSSPATISSFPTVLTMSPEDPTSRSVLGRYGVFFALLAVVLIVGLIVLRRRGQQPV